MYKQIKHTKMIALTLGALSLISTNIALAEPSMMVTNTFVADQPATAEAVNQNFSDVVGMVGMSNGRISTLEAARTAIEGSAQGDMQYWNGSAWVLLAAPDLAKVSPQTTLHFCKDGKPAWFCPYAIGETGPAGGIVFYVTDGGLHGLEASPVDQDGGTGAPWCTDQTDIPTTYTVIGAGAANTAAILALCPEQGSAPLLASAYRLNGYADWFLPSKIELNFLYAQKDVVGGFASNFYWSSSQFAGGSAWYQSFKFGNQAVNDKYITHSVRAVRAF